MLPKLNVRVFLQKTERFQVSFKVKLVTSNESELPPWVSAKLLENGIAFGAKKCVSEAEFLEFAGDSDVVWTMGVNQVITAGSLTKLKCCKAVLRSGSGVDGLPLKEAERLGIRIANTPEAISGTVAEHTVALLFALVRQIPQHDSAVKNGVWNSDAVWAKWHVHGQALGLIGFGHIPRHVVKMLQGFEMKFLVCDPYADQKILQDYGAQSATLDELLEKSDFVSVHCPLSPDTRHLLGEEEFKKMKSNAFLINTSRGAVIDENALLAALKNGWIAGAALDVMEEEPPPENHPLLKQKNVLVTPHIAAFSDEFLKKFWESSINVLVDIKNENLNI